MRWDAAVVLAGGQSSRMGTEKAVLKVGGATLVERLLTALAPRFRHLLVSVAKSGPSPALREAIERAAKALKQEIGILEDRVSGRGPLAGLEAALDSLAACGAFFVPVDVPLVSWPLVSALWKAASSPGCVGSLPRWSRGLEPAYAVYSKKLLPRVQRLLRSGPRSLQALLELEGIEVLDLEDEIVKTRVFGPSPPSFRDLFRNLNTPEELEDWKRASLLEYPP
jgi:molybdopterin-guanine dinucleotide biosynthesis protein A